MTESLLCDVADGHARLTLNRPEAHNPLDGVLLARLGDTLAALEADPTVRVVSLRGAGPSFCAGADLKHFLAILDDAQTLTAFVRSVKAHAEILNPPRAFPAPTGQMRARPPGPAGGAGSPARRPLTLLPGAFPP
jgi:enoyl-CoA hydratase/carnithine racemase